MTEQFYQPSGIKRLRREKRRPRATKAEMEERAEFLIAYAEEHSPVSVRQLYYQAETADVPGIDKTESSYGKVQHQVLMLRRAGRLSYEHISDGAIYGSTPAAKSKSGSRRMR